mgnify:CR=1 FL=1
MNIVNISNVKRNICLFTRDNKGKQVIIEERAYFPYYYEPHFEGTFVGYDGTRLKQCFCSEPADIPKLKSPASFSADIKFVVNYLINKVDKIDKTLIKVFYIDIEVMSNEFPDPEKAKYPVSCISIYNSFTKEVKTWYLGEWKNEVRMLEDFCSFIKREAPDLLIGWNIKFDYTYLFNRIKDFPKKISPISSSRHGEDKNIYYPNGISIIDFMKWDKKNTLGHRFSYALDNVVQEELNEKSWGKTDFTSLNVRVKEKNINDVIRLAKLEEKLKYIDYFDEIRCLAKCQWEDMYFNSRIVEMLLLEEAKLKNVILPNKVERDEETTFQGAIRDTEAKGIFENIGKFDLTSAYPSMIVNFCLDSQNIGNDGINVNGIIFKQNQEALLPSVVRKILKLKDEYKRTSKGTKKYAAIKSIVNSTFGVMGNTYFRLYDNRIASTITYLVRDLLMYVKKRVEDDGLNVIYYDTDSCFLNTTENIVPKLNQYIQDWAKTYSKDNIDLGFEYEGYFTKLFILGKCHYVGYDNKGGKEIKGVEIKRVSSSKYEAWFQEELIDKVLNKEDKYSILDWIEKEKERIKTLPLLEVAFPCKVGTREYKSVPIFMRALSNTKKLFPKFEVNGGERFYYIFVKGSGNNVLAFREEDNFINRESINWPEVIRRNVDSKVQNIFEILNWSIVDSKQHSLF